MFSIKISYETYQEQDMLLLQGIILKLFLVRNRVRLLSQDFVAVQLVIITLLPSLYIPKDAQIVAASKYK